MSKKWLARYSSTNNKVECILYNSGRRNTRPRYNINDVSKSHPTYKRYKGAVDYINQILYIILNISIQAVYVMYPVKII